MAATKGQPPRMTTDEVRLIRSMVHEQGKKPSEVALLVNRSLGAVCRQLVKSRPTQMGRPVALSAKQVAKLVDTVELLVTKAGGVRGNSLYGAPSFTSQSIRTNCVEGVAQRGVSV